MSITTEDLKKILLKKEYITEEDFENLIQESEKKNIPLEILIAQRGIIRDEELGKEVSQIIGYPFVVLQKSHIINISNNFLEYIPEEVAYFQKAIIFEEEPDGSLKLATSNPGNHEFIKQLEQKIGKKIEVYYVTPFNLDMALRRYRGDLKKEVNKIVQNFEKRPAVLEEGIVRLVNMFIEYAYIDQATDIHITPSIETASVRYRVDGILYKVVEYPIELHSRVLSRIKILAQLRTDEHSSTQDGRLSYDIQGESIDIRISIIPVAKGENVVMRMLAQRGKKFTLNEIGLLEKNLNDVKKAMKGSWGMIMASGPTGSGKTTTMYTILHILNQPKVNIMTIEDPVEYKIEGIQQVQINAEKDITFAKGLRSIVRQDPDIILVGEIRDEETAKIAINSAMTGHLILSTIHSNDTATALVRLIEMGVEPFLIASAVSVVIAQKLVRKICPFCSQKTFLTEDEIKFISKEAELLSAIKELSIKDDLSQVEVYKGLGCKLCEGSGYIDRIGLFEVMQISERVRKEIVEKKDSGEVKRVAIEEGMIPMVKDGASKVLAGLTSLEEVIKIIKI